MDAEIPLGKAARPLPLCHQVDAPPEDEYLDMPELVPEEREEHIPPGPTPCTPKMLDSWQAVPRKILQPSPDPERPAAPRVSGRSKKKEAKREKKSRLCGTNRALVDGVWQTDASTHVLGKRPNRKDTAGVTTKLAPKTGMATLRVAYFFSGIESKSSVTDCLREDCSEGGFGLEMHEVDTLVGGDAHYLALPEVQDDWIRKIEDGMFDMVIHSPP